MEKSCNTQRHYTKLSIHINPSYNQDSAADNDLAMLRLSETVDLNIYTPVCLPNAGLFAGQKAWLVGEQLYK